MISSGNLGSVSRPSNRHRLLSGILCGQFAAKFPGDEVKKRHGSLLAYFAVITGNDFGVVSGTADRDATFAAR